MDGAPAVAVHGREQAQAGALTLGTPQTEGPTGRIAPWRTWSTQTRARAGCCTLSTCRGAWGTSRRICTSARGVTVCVAGGHRARGLRPRHGRQGGGGEGGFDCDCVHVTRTGQRRPRCLRGDHTDCERSFAPGYGGSSSNNSTATPPCKCPTRSWRWPAGWGPPGTARRPAAKHNGGAGTR